MDFRAIRLYDCDMTTAAVPDYRLYRERSGETGDFWLHCEPIPDRTRLHRYEIAAHRHPALLQLFDVTRGSGDIFDGSAWRAFAAPCVLFIPPGAVHGFRFARDVDGTVVTVLAERLAMLASDPSIHQFAGAIRVLHDAPAAPLGSIAEEMAGRAVARVAALEAHLVLSVIALARFWQAASGEAGLPAQDPRIEALRDLVATHARERRPLAFYAGRLGLSGAQLNRIARQRVGMTVQSMVESALIDAARRELVFTPTSVSRIAEGLGFHDPAYFNRFFRRHTGMTPGAYRVVQATRVDIMPGVPPAGSRQRQ